MKDRTVLLNDAMQASGPLAVPFGHTGYLGDDMRQQGRFVVRNE
jgi:hypothetical protein